MYRFVLSILFLVIVVSSSRAETWPELITEAREAILVDFETGTVLFEKNADDMMPPASMSKLMTAELVLARLKNGTLNMEDTFRVSERAWRKGGSKMFVEVGKRVAVSDLLRGIIVQSGNDACIVVAEGIAGSEEAFAEMMVTRARFLGMTKSNFTNATGWPDPDHRMTARELAALAQHIITEYPEYYSFYSEREFTFSGIRQANRNPLLYKNVGADGLKTGHTSEAGYGLTASAIRGDRRLVLVINGLSSAKARSAESERILDWGFRNFENYNFASKGEIITEIPVWQGQQKTVPVVINEDVLLTLPRVKNSDLSKKIIYESPLHAPIMEGTPVARLQIANGEDVVHEIALTSANSVDRIGPISRLKSVLKLLFLGTN